MWYFIYNFRMPLHLQLDNILVLVVTSVDAELVLRLDAACDSGAELFYLHRPAFCVVCHAATEVKAVSVDGVGAEAEVLLDGGRAVIGLLTDNLALDELVEVAVETEYAIVGIECFAGRLVVAALALIDIVGQVELILAV